MEIFKHHRSLYQIESFDKRLLSESISSNLETNEQDLVIQSLPNNEIEKNKIGNSLHDAPSPPVIVDVNQQDDVFQDNIDENVCSKPGSYIVAKFFSSNVHRNCRITQNKNKTIFCWLEFVLT